MRSTSLFALLVSILCYADSSLNARRDLALKAINACIQRNEVSSRECKKLNKNVQTLVEIYKQGDKTVLPTLFKFTYLTGFYVEALLADPDAFLTEMSRLSEKDQKAVATCIAGGIFGLRTKERFDAVMALLREIPDSSPIKTTAQICLSAVERKNASFFLSYFPPQTFTGRAAPTFNFNGTRRRCMRLEKGHYGLLLPSMKQFTDSPTSPRFQVLVS